MIQRRFYIRPRYIYFLLLTCFTIASPLGSEAQIVLEDRVIAWKPTEFFIAGVLDERPVKGNYANVLVRDERGKLTGKNQTLRGGLSPAISGFLNRNFKTDRSLRAVNLSIKQLDITETALANGSVQGRIKLNLSFGLKKAHGTEALTGSQFALNYHRNASDTRAIEGHIRSVLGNGLVYFNKWINARAASDWRLARTVKIRFSDYTEKPERDTIYYSANRPLTWADFQSTNIHSYKYDAIVIPGIGYEMTARVANAIIYVDIAVKTYLPKSAAWVRPSAKTAYVLNHEQRHFDVVKIIAGQFKQKVLSEKLTPDTYEAFLNMQYLDTLRDLDKLQKAYDTETSHGSNKIAQDNWNQKIDRELKHRYLAGAAEK